MRVQNKKEENDKNASEYKMASKAFQRQKIFILKPSVSFDA
jgi:hypothetical protein